VDLGVKPKGLKDILKKKSVVEAIVLAAVLARWEGLEERKAE
jgi:hypothetical protein